VAKRVHDGLMGGNFRVGSGLFPDFSPLTTGGEKFPSTLSGAL
jgi:hypothetical protein